MNEIKAVVRRSGDGWVWVETGPAASCSRCQGGGGCSSVSIARLFSSPVREFRIASDEKLEPGERVILALPDDQVLRAALLAYGLPVLGLLLGAIAGAALFPSFGGGDGAPLLLGVLGLVTGLLIARRQSASVAQPVLQRRASGCESQTVVVHPPAGSA